MMPIKLDMPAKDVDIERPEYQAMLANLQANILRPHGRNYARHIFLRFTAPQATVKTWIHIKVAPSVTTAKKQFEQIARRRIDSSFDGGTIIGFFLSASGYNYLSFDVERFASET